MWTIGGKTLNSRLFIGTALYPTLQIMADAILASGAEVITISLCRHNPREKGGEVFWNYVQALGKNILPNTAGCRTAQAAITHAHMSRELFNTNWIKLEVTGDEYNLQPDPFELLVAAKALIKEGFEVFPYCTDDLVLCQRLVDAGCNIIMPWGSPIGSGKGLLNPYALEVLRARLPNTLLLVDAGIGKPSHAAQALELGFDGVLLNAAVALAKKPVQMAAAFRDAVSAGRAGYEAGILAERNCAHTSTALIDTPFWLQEKDKQVENFD